MKNIKKQLHCETVKIVGLAVEVGLHELDTCVESIADLGVIVDPLDCVFLTGVKYPNAAYGTMLLI